MCSLAWSFYPTGRMFLRPLKLTRHAYLSCAVFPFCSNIPVGNLQSDRTSRCCSRANRANFREDKSSCNVSTYADIPEVCFIHSASHRRLSRLRKTSLRFPRQRPPKIFLTFPSPEQSKLLGSLMWWCSVCWCASSITRCWKTLVWSQRWSNWNNFMTRELSTKKTTSEWEW